MGTHNECYIRRLLWWWGYSNHCRNALLNHINCPYIIVSVSVSGWIDLSWGNMVLLGVIILDGLKVVYCYICDGWSDTWSSKSPIIINLVFLPRHYLVLKIWTISLVPLLDGGENRNNQSNQHILQQSSRCHHLCISWRIRITLPLAIVSCRIRCTDKLSYCFKIVSWGDIITVV